jgi:hypothetical protein
MTCCRAGLRTPKPQVKRDLDSMTAIMAIFAHPLEKVKV